MSNYTQKGFNGGMNLLADDTRIASNEYRLALNLRSRFGTLQPIGNGIKDYAAPSGIKQDIRTFGNYVVAFIAGYCYYRHYASTGWTYLSGFSMSRTAPRYWTEIIPIGTQPFVRKAASNTNVLAGVTWDSSGGVANGNVSGILVQDNVNQPYLIYLDPVTNLPKARVTQTYAQWNLATDAREYVPVGNSMAWVDGVLYITSQDKESIYRSVSGRPLDFVVIIDTSGDKAGDATFSSYSVGVGGISCLRPMSSNALFVAAGNSNFSVAKNTTPGAPTICGEYTFIRTFLFNATCLSDRAIIDSLGDTKFIDVAGIRSFNAVQYLQNEGRNSPFSLMVQDLMSSVPQRADQSASILYDNYEFYAVNTTLGAAILVYDTLNNCWASVDTEQTGGSLVKMLTKIELDVQRLYAITTDDQIYTLHVGDTYSPLIRTIAISSDSLRIGPDSVPASFEHKLQTVRLHYQDITEDFDITVTPIVQNELTPVETVTKSITYKTPVLTYTGNGALNDINTNIANPLFTMPACSQGSQTYILIAWNSAAKLMGIDFACNDITPMNPLRSQ